MSYAALAPRGLGASTAAIAGSATAAASSAAAALIMAFAPAAGPAAPIVAAIGAIAGPIIALFQGCGQTCVQATQYANQAGTACAQILSTYQNAPVHYKSTQQAALAAITQIFNQLEQACGNPALGSAGQNCVNQRIVQGSGSLSCGPTGSVGANGQTVTGNNCNWYNYYYYPIATDPNVVQDSPATSTVSGAESALSSLTGSSSLAPLALAAGLILVGVMLSR